MRKVYSNYIFLIFLQIKGFEKIRKILNLKFIRLASYLTKLVDDLPRTQAGKGYVKVPSARHVRFACPTNAYEVLH